MGSKWRKVKLALGMNLCVYSPRNHVADNDDEDDSLPSYAPPSERRSDAALLSPPGDWTSAPATPASNRLRLSKSLSRSSSKVASFSLASSTYLFAFIMFSWTSLCLFELCVICLLMDRSLVGEIVVIT